MKLVIENYSLNSELNTISVLIMLFYFNSINLLVKLFNSLFDKKQYKAPIIEYFQCIKIDINDTLLFTEIYSKL